MTTVKPGASGGVSANSKENEMEEPVRWVSKAEATQEPEVSLSTMDRKIRRGEVEVAREGRRVYLRMHGQKYLSDDELRRAFNREDELERTVRELEREASERERDEARNAASASEEAYRELETAYDAERAAHGRTKRLARTLGLVAAVLFALLVTSVLVAWRLFT